MKDAEIFTSVSSLFGGKVKAPHLRLRQLSSSEHAVNVDRMEELPVSDWPKRLGRRQWPTFPTPSEWVSMVSMRQNADIYPDVPRGKTFSVRYSELRYDIRLRRNVVNFNIVGVRSDVEVPPNFSEYFQYRWGFLILIRKPNATLSSWLLNLWTSDRKSLWTQYRAPVWRFIRHIPIRFSNETGSDEEISEDDSLSEGEEFDSFSYDY